MRCFLDDELPVERPGVPHLDNLTGDEGDVTHNGHRTGHRSPVQLPEFCFCKPFGIRFVFRALLPLELLTLLPCVGVCVCIFHDNGAFLPFMLFARWLREKGDAWFTGWNDRKSPLLALPEKEGER